LAGEDRVEIEAVLVAVAQPRGPVRLWRVVGRVAGVEVERGADTAGPGGTVCRDGEPVGQVQVVGDRKTISA